MNHNISDFACFLAGNTSLNKMAKLQQVIYILKVAVNFMQSHQKHLKIQKRHLGRSWKKPV